MRTVYYRKCVDRLACHWQFFTLESRENSIFDSQNFSAGSFVNGKGSSASVGLPPRRLKRTNLSSRNSRLGARLLVHPPRQMFRYFKVALDERTVDRQPSHFP